ncbi:MAG: pyridoxal-dependent decarboxylase [Deltaproteobacteria bacterium]|nr:pyridoxal-dependent decarboxylase [Myxococcales bacterium]MDP3220680.1 pyridoxal-dependent decarboxylase [Deltaproteobacteria bacterium]
MNDRRKRLVSSLSAIRDKHEIRLDGPGTDAATAWFLGPKGENGELLQRLVGRALTSHLQFRSEVYPADPRFITPEMQSSPEYRHTVARIDVEFDRVLVALQECGAFFSMRSQGHMLWDVTVPAVAGYFAAMLYNQNNVAAEASPVTTMMEIAVGDDLCRMLGFPVASASTPAAVPSPDPRPWGHITCDGSVANMEGMWMARNLKFYAPALVAAARGEAAAAAILDVTVGLLDGQEKRLADCTAWELLNLPIDEVLDLPPRVARQAKIPTDQLAGYMSRYTVAALGMAGAFQEYLAGHGLTNLPVVTAPATNHYSWPKAAALMGIGTNQLWAVDVDLDARQEVDLANALPDNARTLRARLQRALDTRTPVIAVVAVIGSTEESAVDPLHEIVALRDEFRAKGMEFTIHADAAWGGYFASTLRSAGQAPERRCPGGAFRSAALPHDVVLASIPETPMNQDIVKRYVALREVDSVSVDPHKAGYVLYPAGALCYRDSNMRNLVSLKSPVVFHGEADPTVGVFGIEGSKPGAAAAAVYMSHKVIRPTREGYGKLLEQCIFSSKKLYCRLRTMAGPDDPFGIAFIQRLPAERAGLPRADVERQLRDIREWFVGRSNEEIVRGGHYDLFKQLGSDQTILTWAANFKNEDGTFNQDIGKLNDFNNDLYTAFSMLPEPDGDLKNPSDVSLILTSSDFAVPAYGVGFVRGFLARLGVEATPARVAAPDFPAVSFNISTQMDPWFTETADNPQDGFLRTIEEIIRAQILKQIEAMRR